MTLPEWKVQWKRLDPFRVGGDADRDQVSAEWFAQLKHFHVDAVEYGVTKLIGSAQDTFLPGLGLLKDYIQERMGRYDRTPGKCATCHGTTWIESAPWKANGIIYEGLRRCPDCGVPEPQGHEQKVTHRVSDLELHEYRHGRYGRDLMPDGAKAKHPEKVVNPEFKVWAESLKKRLFGVAEDAS